MKYIRKFKETQMEALKEKGYLGKTIEAALEKFMNHPNLVRRLVNLSNSGVKLGSKLQNPWYTEMNDAGVSEDHIAIVMQYLRFAEVEKLKEMSDYRHSGRGVFCTSKTSRLLIPRNNFISF